MRHRFPGLLLSLIAGLLLAACASGGAPPRPGSAPAGLAAAEPSRYPLDGCQGTRRTKPENARACAERDTQSEQPSLEPLMPPLSSMPTLPGGLIR
ncbi:hypothetical protein ED208_12880 [Stagnimonas aquatica]|uniref:Lipoprotein n=1 Tax=Stagnimonas aquatica TaxID=2689987 RepID=A0A3N0V7D1_9GAMM|nr:hypothetical protein [Stagnimonas aquatica]ROH88706.1 hypothetical protein ED208_12880 [Stagnimonas aquatica]